MIDKKYIELIHKDIDRVISQREKSKLDEYLISNPEAQNFYKEIFSAEMLLNEIPDVEPHANLKKKILNSIEYNLYQNNKVNSSVLHFLSSIFSGISKKTAVTFAFGLLAGILATLVISYYVISNAEDVNNVYGAMGISETKFIKSVELNAEDISGNIEMSSRGTNFYEFSFSINSPENYDIKLEFDPAQIDIKDFSCADLDHVKFVKGFGYVQISATNTSKYSVSFSSKNLQPEKISVNIIKNNHKILERSITISH